MFSPVFNSGFIPDEIPNFASFLGDSESSIEERLLNSTNNIIVSIDRGMDETQLAAVEERFGVIDKLDDGNNIDLFCAIKNFINIHYF